MANRKEIKEYRKGYAAGQLAVVAGIDMAELAIQFPKDGGKTKLTQTFWGRGYLSGWTSALEREMGLLKLKEVSK